MRYRLAMSGVNMIYPYNLAIAVCLMLVVVSSALALALK
jgi:hypothetical protein